MALLALAALWRFADLGTRAMSHDESLHAYYSWRYAELGEYRHDPMLHGPLLFHAQALVFLVLGDSDTTARLLPALAGLVLVGTPWLFRCELGRLGALAAGGLLLLSPAVAFYSRYLRNDVWCALFALVWARALLDYRARADRRSLRLLAVAMALSFAAKEIAFLTGAGFGACCLIAALAASRAGDREARGRWLDLAWLQAAFVAPYLAAVAILASGADPAAFDAPGAAGRAGAWGLALALGSAGALALRFRAERHALRSTALAALAGFWAFQLLLYTGLGTQPGHGAASGVAGSLGYWLAQHGVERGGQPAFFYLLLMLLYEPLTWALSLAAAARLLRRARPAARSGEPGERASARAALLFAGWTTAAWLGYSAAGERMPWLVVHLVVPSALLAGWALDAWLPRLRLDLGWRRPAALALAGAAAALLAAGLIARPATAAVTTLRVALLAALVAAGAAVLGLELRRGGRRGLLAAAAGAALGAALLLTLRTSLRATFAHAELAVETLVYAHGTPEVKPALAELEAKSRREVGGLGLEILYDHDTAWPLAWYLRDFPRARGVAGAPPAADLGAPALLLGTAADRALRPLLAFSHERRPATIVWWPLDGYRHWTAADLPGFAADPALWRGALAFWFFRATPGVATEPWPLRKEAIFHLARPPRDGLPLAPLASRAWTELPPVPGDPELEALARPGAEAAAPGDLRFRFEAAERRIVRTTAAGDVDAATARETLPLGARVALAWDSDRGWIWAADLDRRRLLALDPDLVPQKQLEMPLWEAADPADRPLVAVDEAGRLHAAAPTAGAILVWSPNLRPEAAYVAPPGAFPVGVATPPGRLLVADRDHGVVELARGEP